MFTVLPKEVIIMNWNIILSVIGGYMLGSVAVQNYVMLRNDAKQKRRYAASKTELEKLRQENEQLKYKLAHYEA